MSPSSLVDGSIDNVLAGFGGRGWLNGNRFRGRRPLA
jgi:hypothetical protein